MAFEIRFDSVMPIRRRSSTLYAAPIVTCANVASSIATDAALRAAVGVAMERLVRGAEPAGDHQLVADAERAGQRRDRTAGLLVADDRQHVTVAVDPVVLDGLVDERRVEHERALAIAREVREAGGILPQRLGILGAHDERTTARDGAHAAHR
ncbi:MAG: hypothetical protein WKG01_22655 [Kofleriaceae bacterium]